MRGQTCFFILFLACFISSVAQGNFEIDGDKDSFNLSFQLKNDLVIIPVEINGVELSFLLDTGVDSSVLFSLDERDSIEVRNTEIISVRGLGDGEPVEGLKSSGNTIRIGKATNNNFTIYIIYDQDIYLSSRLGIPIHGILGYDLFKDFVIELNYSKKRLKVRTIDSFKEKKCRKCQIFPIVFYRNKPYIKAEVRIEGGNLIPVNLLVDSGSGDALWIFPDMEKGLKVPEKSFKDFLGYGMGGSVYGSRSRVDQLKLGDFDLKSVTASFPDSSYLNNLNTYKDRNGSLGAQVLKRFNLIFQYSNNKISFKPNKEYGKPFEYDMSGVVVAHDGFTLVRGVAHMPQVTSREDSNTGEIVFSNRLQVDFFMEPQFRIVEIRPGSPAEEAGLLTGDLLRRVNGRPASKLDLAEIAEIFSSGEGEKIKLRIERNGIEKKIEFRLERIL